MARPKKRDPKREQVLQRAKEFLDTDIPSLSAAPLCIKALDAMPGGPCYAVTAERCMASKCPYGVSPDVAAAGNCPVLTCYERQSVRMLVNEDDEIIQATLGNIRWK